MAEPEDVSVEEIARRVIAAPFSIPAHHLIALAEALLSERRKGREEGLEAVEAIIAENMFLPRWLGERIRSLKDKKP